MPLLGPASSLGDLARLRDARSGRASSWDQSGRNKDYWLLRPGSTTVLADLKGALHTCGGSRVSPPPTRSMRSR